jgi:cell division protein FtsB
MDLLSRVSPKVFFILCAAVGAYFFAVFVQGAIDNANLRTERQEAVALRDALAAEKRDAEATRKYASSDAYVEQVARRQFGMTRPGEIPYVVDSPPLDIPLPNGKWWQRLIPR